jgi:hypothetical protein
MIAPITRIGSVFRFTIAAGAVPHLTDSKRMAEVVETQRRFRQRSVLVIHDLVL